MICTPSNCETPAEQSRELIRESWISTLLSPANWQELMPGDTVLLIGHDQQRNTGTVDTASADGSFLWIMHSNGNERRLFIKDEVSRTVLVLMDL
ncbi:hypothetical protein AHiyo8_pI66430 (plasmid) [Arthrobacter sp. Hiyo8]|jgi:hypothetical protein|nr:hypothetical protein AHiyo8_pI66430 [Arthrobacter sp. Hiyo8]GAP60864.1 hypothetical protein AHiyo1_44660 [Arthrobacter sp. Hiyo1]